MAMGRTARRRRSTGVSASNRSYGGSYITFELASHDGSVELAAEVDGLNVYVRDTVTREQVRVQVIQWDQVDTWMEAAEAAEREELVQTSQRDWAVRERERRSALKGK
jgi:hypothetical protein